MRKDIKLEIIKVSKELFNARGYNEVSTQDIADAMGISKGNLNYHFKKKENIIEAVVEEMHSHYVEPSTPTTLKELNTLFLQAQKVAKENAFYFWHYTQLAQMSDRIRKIQNTVIENNAALFSEAFKRLNEDGIMQSEEYPGQYEQVVQVIMLTCTYWIPYSKLKERIDKEVDFRDCIWSILYPLLTGKGKTQYSVLKNASSSPFPLPMNP